jgi:hypothetical protein
MPAVAQAAAQAVAEITLPKITRVPIDPAGRPLSRSRFRSLEEAGHVVHYAKT